MLNRFERFSYAISEISRYWHKIAADEMEKYGLKGPFSVYLITLRHHEEGLTAVRLGELCGRDKSDVSRAVTILEKNGFVTKKRVGHNLYRANICLTDVGKTAADYIAERADLAVQMGGQGISDQERTVFYNTLEKIAANLQEVSKDGLPKA
ncbi:MAG: winged helix-turn-helix transcriptional regulator [Clostridia bacterium]|nr:winged helix-turn-helix transcriptional regulator [Clostridia bacterium]